MECLYAALAFEKYVEALRQTLYYIGIQPATVLIADLVLKFVLYFLPDFDLLWINPGITNLIHENAGRLAFTCLAYAAFMASLIFAIQKKKVDYERNRNQKPL